MKTKEIWKDIPNYEGLYQVSNLGRVRSLDKIKIHNISGNEFLKKGKILKGCVDYAGYKHVVLYSNKKSKTTKIHKLVSIVFLNHKPCGHKLVVDHINANKLDNRLCNLQLISQRKNSTKENRGVSKYIGVDYLKKRGKWRSRICINGKEKYLGLFNNEYDAYLAYKKELLKINKNE
jgi:hypothetical protein